jgi:ferredoxin
MGQGRYLAMEILCGNCNHPNPRDVTNCVVCGSLLSSKLCPRCSQPLRDKSRFCSRCGMQMGSAPQPPVTPPVQAYRGAPQSAPAPRPMPSQPAPEVVHTELKDRTLLLKEQFGNLVTQGNYREILQKKDSPVTSAFIDFIAWGISRFSSFIAFIAGVTVLGVLLGGWGVVLAIALTYVYSKHKDNIRQRVAEMKGESLTETKKKGKGYSFFINERCTVCGNCAEICPTGAIVNALDRFIIDDERCNLCGKCYTECPSGAIQKS